MTPLFKLQTGVHAFWMDVLTAQMNAARTIAARTAILVDTSTAATRRRATRESRSMVAEKIKAVSDGALAGSRALMSASPKGLADPVVASRIALKAARAAFEPARQRVGANARRLTKT